MRKVAAAAAAIEATAEAVAIMEAAAGDTVLLRVLRDAL